MVACIGAVPAAASLAVARTRSTRSDCPRGAAQDFLYGDENIEHRLLAGLRAAPRADGADAGAEHVGKIVRELLAAQRFADREKEAAVKRPRGAADRHDQGLADNPKRLVDRLRADGIEFAEHGLESPLHVDAVVAVADRLVERGQFRRAGDDLFGGGFHHRLQLLWLKRHRAHPQ